MTPDQLATQALAEIRIAATTARRSLGQRFRHIEERRQKLFEPSMMCENAWRLVGIRADLHLARLRGWV